MARLATVGGHDHETLALGKIGQQDRAFPARLTRASGEDQGTLALTSRAMPPRVSRYRRTPSDPQRSVKSGFQEECDPVAER